MISIYPPVTIRAASWTVLPVEIRILDERLRDPSFSPEYKTDGASGIDLRVMSRSLGDGMVPMMEMEDMVLWPGRPVTLGSGLAIALPPGYEGQIRPRSSLFAQGIITDGTIDSDYRGQIGVTLINMSHQAIKITGLDRIAQLVIAPVVRAELHMVDALPPTDRGSGGYGSTGVR